MCERELLLTPTSLSTARNTNPGPDVVAATERVWEHVLRAHQATFESIDRARAAGVTIAAGPDRGSRYDPGEHAGDLARIVEAGLPLLQGIQAAIRTNAQLRRLENEIGSLHSNPRRFRVSRPDPLQDVTVLEDAHRHPDVHSERRTMRKLAFSLLA